MRKSTKNGDVVADFLMHQTSGAEVTGSNPASPTMILMCCRITVYYFRVMKPVSKNKLKIYFYWQFKQQSFYFIKNCFLCTLHRGPEPRQVLSSCSNRKWLALSDVSLILKGQCHEKCNGWAYELFLWIKGTMPRNKLQWQSIWAVPLSQKRTTNCIILF